MIVDTITGNIIDIFKEGKGNIIHGCNCFHTMGAGLARQIRENFPEAYHADLATKKGDRLKLGSVSEFHHENGNIIFNAYTQYGLGNVPMYLDDIRKCYQRAVISCVLHSSGSPLYTPKVGCGIAGCSWKELFDIIDKATGGYPVVVVNF